VECETVARQSADGHHNFHHRKFLWRVHLLLKGLTMSAEQDLLNWWAWAMQGNYYAVAKDGSKTLNTTFNNTSTLGTSTVYLTSTSTVVAGDYLLLTDVDRTIYEIVCVQSVSAGVSVTTTAVLKNTFVSGDSCRHLFYLPRVVSLDDKFPLNIDGEGSTNIFDFDHVVEEDLA
jgi:hypothetical protein